MLGTCLILIIVLWLAQVEIRVGLALRQKLKQADNEYDRRWFREKAQDSFMSGGIFLVIAALAVLSRWI